MNRLGVVGCGLMGSGIAEVGAKSGCDVLVVDTNDEILGVAQKRMQASLA
jgi:3-hydroxybutyryl-CoA dehydrogenase